MGGFWPIMLSTVHDRVPLQFFFIPPDEVPIKQRWDGLSVTCSILADPLTDEQKKVFEEGKAVIYVTMADWFWGVPPYPGIYEEWYPGSMPGLTAGSLYAPVDGTMKYDPNGEYLSRAMVRLTSDLIGKEINLAGYAYRPYLDVDVIRTRFRKDFSVDYYELAAPPWPGAYDMRAKVELWKALRDIPTKPVGFEIRNGYRLPYWADFTDIRNLKELASSPLYAALNSCGYKITRDQIKEFHESRGKINFAGVMAEVIEKIKDMLKLANVKYLESSFPEIVAAGEPFSATHRFYNEGEPGMAQLRLIADGDMTTTSFTANKIASFPESLNMPWDDLKRNYLVELLSPVPTPIKITKLTLEGKDYKPFDLPSLLTDSKSFASFIPAGFPVAALGSVDAPDRQRAGDVFTLDLPITNTGYRGDIGVRIIAPGFEQDIMQRIDSGATITPRYTGEMSATESFRITAIPIYLGRNKETVLGAEKVFEITPRNTLFHWDGVVKVFGGYAERNEFTGFVAGKNVRVKGLTITPGTGPLPFGYAGYMLTGTLGEGETAEIEYDELYYLRVEVVSGIAIARRGALVERDTKLYEYSVLPTPAMASHAFKSIGSLLSRTATKLEMR